MAFKEPKKREQEREEAKKKTREAVERPIEGLFKKVKKSERAKKRHALIEKNKGVCDICYCGMAPDLIRKYVEEGVGSNWYATRHGGNSRKYDVPKDWKLVCPDCKKELDEIERVKTYTVNPHTILKIRKVLEINWKGEDEEIKKRKKEYLQVNKSSKTPDKNITSFVRDAIEMYVEYFQDRSNTPYIVEGTKVVNLDEGEWFSLMDSVMAGAMGETWKGIVALKGKMNELKTDFEELEKGINQMEERPVKKLVGLLGEHRDRTDPGLHYLLMAEDDVPHEEGQEKRPVSLLLIESDDPASIRMGVVEPLGKRELKHQEE